MEEGRIDKVSDAVPDKSRLKTGLADNPYDEVFGGSQGILYGGLTLWELLELHCYRLIIIFILLYCDFVNLKLGVGSEKNLTLSEIGC